MHLTVGFLREAWFDGSCVHLALRSGLSLKQRQNQPVEENWAETSGHEVVARHPVYKDQ